MPKALTSGFRFVVRLISIQLVEKGEDFVLKIAVY